MRTAPTGIESESAEERSIGSTLARHHAMRVRMYSGGDGGGDEGEAMIHCSSFQHSRRMRGLFIVPAHLRSLTVRGGDYERRYGFVSHRYLGRVVLRSLAFAYANIRALCVPGGSTSANTCFPIWAPRTSDKHDFETQVYIECNTPRNHLFAPGGYVINGAKGKVGRTRVNGARSRIIESRRLTEFARRVDFEGARVSGKERARGSLCLALHSRKKKGERRNLRGRSSGGRSGVRNSLQPLPFMFDPATFRQSSRHLDFLSA
ncbi:hypothetical protein B0H16DRAFT_1457484 [Mycena metata]|uniref:Uncharacterized protein n=1 Tax=Mycena metata TaxID=1033252 RepID=A0AAD7J9F5_9AGAR|nr:hypothetical protein B0H16DRAFT_1457484 [Mycena metata]